MLLRMLLLCISLGMVLGAPLSAAELAALLMPLALQLGMEHMVETGRSMAAAGLEAAAIAYLIYVRIRLWRARRVNHDEHHLEQPGQGGGRGSHHHRRPFNRKRARLNWHLNVLQNISLKELWRRMACRRRSSPP